MSWRSFALYVLVMTPLALAIDMLVFRAPFDIVEMLKTTLIVVMVGLAVLIMSQKRPPKRM